MFKHQVLAEGQLVYEADRDRPVPRFPAHLRVRGQARARRLPPLARGATLSAAISNLMSLLVDALERTP
jgi:hypothetical protein